METPLFGVQAGDWIAITVNGTEILLEVRRVDGKRLDLKRVSEAHIQQTTKRKGRLRARHKGDIRGVNSVAGKRPDPSPGSIRVGRDTQGNLRTASGLVIPEGKR